MTVRKRLVTLADVVAREAERNEVFRLCLEVALGLQPQTRQGTDDAAPKRKGGRRTPAVLDPVGVVRVSEDELRRQLASLDIEQLRDVVAHHGMDPGKLVMKWKDPTRIVDRIVELAVARSKKGDAFRAD